MSSMDAYRGKVALITGGGKGIGYSIASGLSHHGMAVVLTGRSADALDKAKEDIVTRGGLVEVFPTDLSKYGNVLALKAFVLERFRTVDVLVNNAAGWLSGMLEDADVQEIDQIIDTTIKAPIWLCREFLPVLSKNAPSHIINITTLGVRPGRSNATPVYIAAKAGLAGFTESLRRYAIKQGVRVSEVLPGSVASEFPPVTAPEKIIEKHGGSRYPAKDIAETIEFILTRSEAAMVEDISLPAIGDWAEDWARY